MNVSAQVSVMQPDLSISADPERIRSEQTSEISWTADNVEGGTCEVSGPNGVIGTGASGTAETDTLSRQSTYTLSCENHAGEVFSEDVSVGLVPQFEEF